MNVYVFNNLSFQTEILANIRLPTPLPSHTFRSVGVKYDSDAYALTPQQQKH